MLTNAPSAASAPAPVSTDSAPTSQLAVAEALMSLLRDTTTEPRPDIQLEALTLAVSADLPVLLWGEPGIGKTAALTQLAASLDLPLTTVIASVHEPSDFSGLPIVGDDPAEQGVPMAPPDWAVRLVRAGKGLLFLDELSTAPPAVQAALLRLVLERRIGSLQLPPGVRIVAAANPRSSAADGWELSPPLANRFVHLQWTHDHEVVVRGLAGTWPRATLPRLDPEKLPESVDFARRAVCGLLSARPTLVHRLPTTETRRGGPWPSPRSWDMTLNLIAFATAAGSSRDVLSLLVRGTVGDGPGLELLASLDRMDLPDPEDLLADPAGAVLPERGDLRQAALDGVVAAVRTRPDRARWDAAWAVSYTHL
ncbi:AAA family ATPase, partial [Streptomyces sp. wa1071]|uniref:AAA family ATPase n=1 Tax=Streptomyces sp. wa1071 TaxID=1828217 RepID=UPI000BF19B34